MGNNITDRLKYKESVVKFSKKYGVAKAAYKFGECKRNELSFSRLANTLSFQKFNSDSNCSPIFDNTIEVLDENNFPKIDNLNVLITGILKEVEGIISTSIEHDSRTNTISKFKLNANGDKVEVSLSDETPPCIKGKLSPLLTVCVFALNYFGQANRSSHIQDTNFNKSYRKALKEFIKCCSFQNNHKICKTRIDKWVADKTRHMIETLDTEIERDSLMVVLDAIYMKAKWEEPFDSSLTDTDMFHNFP